MPGKANCPRCDTVNSLPCCRNCGKGAFTWGALSNNEQGCFCQACNVGMTHFPCRQCGTQISVNSVYGSCFVATELYGSDSSEVATLRKWRDERLNGHRLGRLAVAVYYAVSPTLVVVSRRARPVRWALRVAVGAVLAAVSRRVTHTETT